MNIYYPELNQNIEEVLIGGKAWNLNLMNIAGINVPKWFVVTTDCEVNYNLESEILETINKLGMSGKFLAVRSSAVGEDNQDASFAGQMESFLYVQEKDVFEKIKLVIQSSCSERNLFYRKQHGLDVENIKVAVIIQEMIDSEISGVAFSINPTTGNRNSTVISSVYGLGEGLVSGDLDADTYVVENNEISKTIVQKSQKIVFNNEKAQGTVKIEVQANEQNISSLSEEQIKTICLEVEKIVNFYGRPQDIEWAIFKNTLYILQSRPVTILDQLPDKTAQEIIWDNSNIIESYSGVTTPLTFSFIKDVYTEVYKQFCLIMGVELELIEKNSDIFQMLGLIEGRVYYNLLNWYKVLMLLPGYEINAAFMEQMMGVKQKLAQKPNIKESTKNKYLRVVNLLFTLIINLIHLPKDIEKFYSHIDKTLSKYEKSDLNKFKPNELVEIFYELESKLLKKWQAPLVNDFYAMIFYGSLKKMILKYGVDDSGTLQNDLLTGEGEIISTLPIRKIREISNRIIKEENLRNLFLNNSEETIKQKIKEYPINKEIQDFIDKFGNRCIGELKLETITYKQDPQLLFYIIKSYVKQGYVDLEKEKQNEQKIRENAEKLVREKIKSPIKLKLFNFVLKNARLRVRNRENLRFERTRLYGLVRELFLAIGGKFYSEGIIDEKRDIFYLTKEEIFSYILGTSASINLKELIKQRKSEFADFESQSPADRFSTFGIVYRANSFLDESAEKNESGDIKGIGCCAGIVKAKVRIVRNVNESKDLEGHIMVCERTDPGWVPLFPISKGILVERGSILSHSAIVAREMGIPAIVGINNLLNSLKDNDEVEMDGSTGFVKIIQRAEG